MVIHFFYQYVCSLGIEPTTFALLTQCSTTEPQEHVFYIFISVIQHFYIAIISHSIFKLMYKQHKDSIKHKQHKKYLFNGIFIFMTEGQYH